MLSIPILYPRAIDQAIIVKSFITLRNNFVTCRYKTSKRMLHRSYGFNKWNPLCFPAIFVHLLQGQHRKAPDLSGNYCQPLCSFFNFFSIPVLYVLKAIVEMEFALSR